jgi:hypothetical protein
LRTTSRSTAARAFNWERQDIDYHASRWCRARTTCTARCFDRTARCAHLSLREDTHATEVQPRLEAGPLQRDRLELHRHHDREPGEDRRVRDRSAREWLGGLLGTEASLFYYKLRELPDLHAQQLADATPEFVVINANNAEVYGAEVNARVTPWQGGYVNVNFGWLETQFLDFLTVLQVRERPPNRFPFIAGREIQNSGNPVLNSPRFKVSITAEQTIPLGKYGFLIPRYDGAWSDITYYDRPRGVAFRTSPTTSSTCRRIRSLSAPTGSTERGSATGRPTGGSRSPAGCATSRQGVQELRLRRLDLLPDEHLFRRRPAHLRRHRHRHVLKSERGATESRSRALAAG